MKNKSIAFVLSLALVTLISLACISAASFSLSTGSLAFIESAKSLPITVTTANMANGSTISASPILISDDSSSFSVSMPAISSIDNSTARTVNVTSTVDYSKLSVGKEYNGNLVLVANGNASDTLTLPVSFAKSFCAYGENGSDLKITSLDINKDYDWNTMDNVTIDVDVRNYNTSSKKVKVELSLYSLEDDSFVKLDGNKDLLEQSIRITDGSTETFSFSFKVTPKFKEGDYKLYVKAYETSNEETQCTSKIDSEFSKSVSITYNTDEDVVIDEINAPTTLSCGSSDTVSFKVYNLAWGDDEDFSASMSIPELGIKSQYDKFTLNDGDYKTVSFDLTIPENASEKIYRLSLKALYDYSSSTFFKDTGDNYYTTVKVTNCKFSQASITADLSSDTPRALVGQQVAVVATIKNVGTSSETYTVGVSGNSDWSSVASIDPKTVTVNAGESKKVTIYLDVNGDAELGDRQFTISAVSSTGTSTSQKVAITLEKGFSTSAIINHLKNNWYIYVIVLVNLILIIAIIFVIAKLVRKSD